MRAADFLVPVSRELQDESCIRWPLAELAGYVDDGQMYCLTKAPHAACEERTLTLAEGSRQSVPADCLGVLEMYRNDAGKRRAISQVRRADMDAAAPAWGSSRAKAAVVHFVQDARTPQQFEVWPAAQEGVQVQALLALRPRPVGLGAEGALTLRDEFHEALRHYVLYRAYSKDAEFASNAQLAVTHLQACHESLGVVPARPRTGEDLSG